MDVYILGILGEILISSSLPFHYNVLSINVFLKYF